MRVIVTGGAGFIGSTLVDKLIYEKIDTVVLDNLSSGKFENIYKHVKSKYFRFDDVNILDKEAVLDIFKVIKPDVVFHLAAIPNVSHSVLYPLETSEVNLLGTISVLDACRVNNVKKIIFSSSASVYGDSSDRISESYPLSPLTPYAMQKKMSEEFISLYNKLYGIDYTILRYFNVYGPRQNSSSYSSVIQKIIEAKLKDEVFNVYGDGSQKRDFVFVKNIVFANYYSAFNKLNNKIYNVGSGSEKSINDLIEYFDIKKVKYHEPKIGDIKNSYCDISLIKSDFSFKPADFSFGMKNTLEYIKEEKSE